MADWVQIANLAGGIIGTETRITSPDDDRTLARSIRNVWDLQRRSAIREGSWNFAMRRASLPALNETPAFGFSYAYQLPAANLRLIEVIGLDRDEYQAEDGKVLCNASGPLLIRHMVDVDNVALWDDLFAETFAARIAWKIGAKIAGSSFDKASAWRMYEAGLAASKRVDAMENPPIEREESDWVTARHGGAFWDPRT